MGIEGFDDDVVDRILRLSELLFEVREVDRGGAETTFGTKLS